MSEYNVPFTDEDHRILSSCVTLVEGLADYLGGGYEIVLHSLEDVEHSVVKIINGHHTGRTTGAPITDLALSMLSRIENENRPGYISYFSRNKKGEPLKAATIAIRGVGGQGNLFFGKVLAQVAFLAGYDDRNILKGETHGMAQMGGPVISTFGCGEVFSPALVPGTANVLIAMEKAEVLRPGFLDLLEPGGTVLMADTRILPHGLKPEAYPSDEAIAAQLEGYRVVSVDVLSIALNLGDPKGRCANVAMLGVLSTLPPFDVVPEAVWLQALRGISRKPALWDLNHAAFMAGRGMQKG